MMTERRPRVSIGLPVYNGEAFIADAISSFRAQSFDDFELIVSDNAWTDATEDIVREFASADPRIRYLRSETNVGANRNFNRTYYFATGEYFKWAAHDDVVEPTFIERCVSVLNDDPTVVLVHSRTSYIGGNGEALRPLARGYLGADGFVERLTLDDSVSDALGSGDPVVRFDAVVNRMSVFYDVSASGARTPSATRSCCVSTTARTRSSSPRWHCSGRWFGCRMFCSNAAATSRRRLAMPTSRGLPPGPTRAVNSPTTRSR